MNVSAQAAQNPFLAAKALACRRGDRLLFRALSLDVRGGEALHVTGANGTGKTTLIRALAGLRAPFAGEISCKGSIGLLDERPALDLDMPLRKAMRFWQQVDDCTDPETAMDNLGLSPLMDVPVGYLSTGQRKRAALASLINRKAPIWLLDEPLSGLDAGAIEHVTGIIAAHMEAGGVAIIASHQALALDDLKTLAIEDFAPTPQGAP